MLGAQQMFHCTVQLPHIRLVIDDDVTLAVPKQSSPDYEKRNTNNGHRTTDEKEALEAASSRLGLQNRHSRALGQDDDEEMNPQRVTCMEHNGAQLVFSTSRRNLQTAAQIQRALKLCSQLNLFRRIVRQRTIRLLLRGAEQLQIENENRRELKNFGFFRRWLSLLTGITTPESQTAVTKRNNLKQRTRRRTIQLDLSPNTR